MWDDNIGKSEDNLNEARAKVTFTNYRNSLIEWTLTDAWTKPPMLFSKFNGKCKYLNNTIDYCDSCNGEIDAKY